MSATNLDPSVSVAQAQNKTAEIAPDGWALTGGTTLKTPQTPYETVYEKKLLQDNKESLDLELNTKNDSEGKFKIKAIAFLREKENMVPNRESLEPTNHMTIWYDYPAQRKLDLGLNLLGHPWLNFFKSNYCYSHDELHGVGARITINVGFMQAHFVEEFFAFLERETDLSKKASVYFRSLAGCKAMSPLESKYLNDIEAALQNKNYDEALKITKEVHAASIKENQTLHRTYAYCDRQGNPKEFYWDEARAAYDLGLRLLPNSPEYAYKALEILNESSPYFKEAQEKMANILLHNIGGDRAYRKIQPTKLEIVKAREHLMLSDSMSDISAMELALQHNRYDDALGIAKRIHTLSKENSRAQNRIYDLSNNLINGSDQCRAAYDLYLKLYPISTEYAYKALEILDETSTYFKEAQEKMANILLLNCGKNKNKKEMKENAEKALLHLARAGNTSPNSIYLQILAKDILASTDSAKVVLLDDATETSKTSVTFQYGSGGAPASKEHTEPHSDKSKKSL